jgi:glucosyl-dolichyl phosphate glucuronosyltransferase
MRLSVAICTRNRAECLRQVLRSISRCTHPPAGDWEVVVVDNGSEDHTREVAIAESGNFPCAFVEETTPGLSNARNRAVGVSRGEWILWTDDDASVSEGWLTGYYDAIGRYPDAQAFGGPIQIVLEGQPEGWLTRGIENVKSAFAGLGAEDIGETFGPSGVVPYGANFALRRAFLERHGFDPELGRHPQHQLRGGEETQAIRQAVLEGTGYWLRDAPVWHHIDPGRQTRRYLRDYYYSYGYRQAIRFSDRSSRSGLVSEMLVSFRAAVQADARLLFDPLAEETTLLLKDAARSWGEAFGLLKLVRTRRRRSAAARSANEV